MRAHERSASPMRAHSATLDYGTSESNKRARSQPVFTSRNLNRSRRFKQRTVREVSSKLVEVAKKSYFHGSFTSSHGSLLVPPSLAQQIATHLPSDYPASPLNVEEHNRYSFAGEKPRRRMTSRRPLLADPNASFTSAGNVSVTSLALTYDSLSGYRGKSADGVFHSPFHKKLQSAHSPPPDHQGIDVVTDSSEMESPIKNRDASPVRVVVEPAESVSSEKSSMSLNVASTVKSPVSAGKEEDTENSISVGGAVLNLLFLAVPAAVALGFQFCTSIIPLAFVGFLEGEKVMTGISVGYFFTSSLILYPMIGLTFAMDTLCSHEFGREGESGEAGLILQRGILINFIALAPLCIGLYFVKGLLVSLYGTETAEIAFDFLHFAPLFIYPTAALIALTKFLNNQLQAHIPMIALTAGVFVTPLIQFKLTPLGPRYTMLGMACTTCFQLAVMTAITLVKPETRRSLGSWRLREALQWEDVREYLKLAVPSALFVAAEASSFDVTILLGAKYGETQGSVWSALMNILFIFASLSGGVSTSACANIGRCVGADDPVSVRRYVTISIVVAFLIGLVDSFIIVVFFNSFLSVFGITGASVNVAAPLVWLLPVFHIADSIQFIFQGIFSGLGQNGFGAIILLGSLWGIGLPLAFIFGSLMKWGIWGVCLGMTIGLCVEAPTMVIVAMRYLDYDKICYLHILDEELEDEEEEEESEESYDEDFFNEMLRRSGIVLHAPPKGDGGGDSKAGGRFENWKELLPRNYRKKYSF